MIRASLPPSELALQTQLETIAARYEAREPETFWMLSEGLRALMASTDVREAIVSLLDRAMAGPREKIAGVLSDRVLLGSARGLTLMVRPLALAADRSAPRVQSTPYSMLAGVMGPGRLTADVYRAGESWNWAGLDASCVLSDGGTRKAGVGEVLAVDGRREVCQLHTEGPTVLLTLLAPRHTSLLWQFEVQSGRPCRMIAGSPAETRLQFAADILDRLGDAGSVPALRRMCDHESHQVRWSALQALLGLDRKAGLERLVRAQVDPHPHVRAAARRSLARFAGREAVA